MTDYERPDLARYASRSRDSRGRRYPEEFKDDRPHFERDRDRIIHCAAFRRLEYKTQVFVNHEGDYYRTRLTHSLEVAQIARGIARKLRLNEELTEAVALAHDLGHTPFGHAGEDALNRLMAEHGGFEHNLQSLRVVEKLEERYPGFPGLNLTWETREGLAKHSSFHDSPHTVDLSEYGLQSAPSLEAQIINLADEIAYNNHDIDDGLESGLVSLEELIADIDLGILLRAGEWGYVWCEKGQYTCHAGEGVMIRDGELAEQVRDVSISGMTLETLASALGVSRDFEMEMAGTCGKAGQTMSVNGGGPYVKVREIVVGGQG